MAPERSPQRYRSNGQELSPEEEMKLSNAAKSLFHKIYTSLSVREQEQIDRREPGLAREAAAAANPSSSSRAISQVVNQFRGREGAERRNMRELMATRDDDGTTGLEPGLPIIEFVDDYTDDDEAVGAGDKENVPPRGDEETVEDEGGDVEMKDATGGEDVEEYNGGGATRGGRGGNRGRGNRGHGSGGRGSRRGRGRGSMGRGSMGRGGRGRGRGGEIGQ